MASLYFNHFNQIVVGTLVAAFLSTWIRKRLKGRDENLETIINSALAASTMPTTGALILCAFDGSLVNRLDSLGIHLAIAGVVVFFVAYKILEKDW